MKENGFVFLPPNFQAILDDTVDAVVCVDFIRWSDVSRTVNEVKKGIALTELKRHLDEHPVERLTAVLPNSSASSFSVDVPTKNPRQLKQALPFIVEEYSAQDPESLLLISNFKPVDNKLDVIAVDELLINKVTQLMKEEGIAVVEAYSIEQLIPALEKQTLIILDHSTAYISTATGLPVGVPIGQLAWVFPRLIEATLDESLVNIKLVQTEQCELSYSEAEEAIQNALHDDVNVEFYSQKVGSINEYLASLAGPGANQPSYQQNLLIDKYKPEKKKNPWLSLFAPVVVLGSVVLCAHLSLSLYEGWQYQQRANALQSQIYSTLKRAIPTARVEKLRSDRAIRSRIKSALARSGKTDDSAILNQVTHDLIKALQSFKASAPYIQRMSYRSASGETQLELHASSFAQVDQVKESLTSSGYSVTVGSVSNDGGLFKGRLTLRAREG